MDKRLNTPEKLSAYMSKNIKYGYVRNDGTKKTGIDNSMHHTYRLQTPQQVYDNNIGVCWDQVEFERFIFSNVIKLPFKTYYIEQRNLDHVSHTFLIYQKRNSYYLFENSFEKIRGIYKFESIMEALLFERKNMKEQADDKGVACFEYGTPRYGTGVIEFITHCTSGRQILLPAENTLNTDEKLPIQFDYGT